LEIREPLRHIRSEALAPQLTFLSMLSVCQNLLTDPYFSIPRFATIPNIVEPMARGDKFVQGWFSLGKTILCHEWNDLT
jgi:hypothetical protein